MESAHYCPLRMPTLRRLWLVGGMIPPKPSPHPKSRPGRPFESHNWHTGQSLLPYFQILTSMSQGYHNKPSMVAAVSTGHFQVP